MTVFSWQFLKKGIVKMKKILPILTILIFCLLCISCQSDSNQSLESFKVVLEKADIIIEPEQVFEGNSLAAGTGTSKRMDITISIECCF